MTKGDAKKAKDPNEVKVKAVKKSKSKVKFWTFPQETLEDSIKVAKAIEEKNGGNPMEAGMLAKAVGFNQAGDWRFQNLLKAANYYALIVGSGASATVELTKLGQDVVAPSSPDQRKKALLEAFRKVEDFAKVEDFYNGKKLPEDEYFLNTLTRQFGIDKDRVERFKAVFSANLAFLREFDATGVKKPDPAERKAEGGESSVEATVSLPKEHRVREFLDTCFVMMPFGGWFDRYYQEIYSKAIKDAGFEPVRGDEIFTTGSVVEQIWEQVTKSKVLLADLTDKNANVFYELGLAHAAGKPVVLTSNRLDDVPFDLRHLRVIIYDTREPDWATKLFKLVSDHLKSAKSEPDKSIPQPFRQDLSDGRTG